MPGGVRIEGAVAELRFAYRKAADLRDFSMYVDDGVTHCVATVVSQDPLWVSQRPLVIAVPGRPWRWPVMTLQIDQASLHATVGSCEG